MTTPHLIKAVVMTDTITCKNCGTVLDEDFNGNDEERQPCPNCGSKERRFSVSTVLELRWSIEAAASVISDVNLLLQAIIIPSEKTNEGQLIEAVALPWFKIIEFLKSDPSIAYQIPYRKWEEIIAGAYKIAGFDEVTLTPRSGDYGRDVIAVKRGLGSVRVIDQVKAYKPGHLVNADDVRALMGVLTGDGASKGFLTTTSDFAPKIREDPFITLHIPSRLELINGKMLLKRLEELTKK